MNRQIKFRAWDKEGNDYSKWLPQMIYQDEWAKATETVGSRLNPTLPSRRFIYMQFTGLTDKNGKEIYEGDIVLWGTDLIGEVERPCKIEYNLEQARFEVLQYWDNQGKWDSLSNDLSYYSYRIIGNVYENPELINAN